MNRPSSIYEDYLQRPARPDVPATVLVASSQGTVDVQLASGEVLRRVNLAGSADAGDRVLMRYDDHGAYTALGSRPSSVASGAAYLAGSGAAGGSTLPDPHELIGIHHSLPTVSSGQVFAAPVGTIGTPVFRALASSDLPSLTVSAGAGMTGGGNLPSVTLSVGAGNGIVVGSDSVGVNLAPASGLSFLGAGLQLADGVAGNGLTMDSATRAISVGVGNGIGVSGDAVSVNLAATSGMAFLSGALQIGQGDGISVLTGTVAVDSTVVRTTRTISAGNGLSGGGTLAADRTISVNDAYAFTWNGIHTHTARPVFGAGITVSVGQSVRFGADVDLTRKGVDILSLATGDALESSTFQSGVSGWRVSAAGDAEFGNIRARGELATTVFRFNEISATAGTLGVYYSASVVLAEFTTPAGVGAVVANVQIRNATPASTTAMFSMGDRVQIRVWNGTVLVAAWFTVSAAPAASTGVSTYSLKLESGSAGVLVPAGTAVVNWGPATGGAAITLTADGSIGRAPNISMQTTAGSPWSDAVLQARLGNLRNSYDYDNSQDAFGFAAGGYGTSFVSVDASRGFRVVRNGVERFRVFASGELSLNNSAGDAVISMDTVGNASIAGTVRIGSQIGLVPGTDPYIAIGDTAFPTTPLANGNGIWLGKSGGVAQLRVGSASSGALSAGMHWNGSSLNVIGAITATSGSISGVLSIGASGEVRQGAGSLTATPATFTGLRIWSQLSGGTYYGRIGGYNAGTLQWFADTDGKLKAAGGFLSLEQSGLLITASASSYSQQRGVHFLTPYHTGAFVRNGTYAYASAADAYLYIGNYTGTATRAWLTLAGEHGIELEGGTVLNAAAQSMSFLAGTSAILPTDGITFECPAAPIVFKSDVSFAASGSVVNVAVSGGVNVGAATGALSGEVRAQELRLGAASDVRLYRSAADMLRIPDSATIDGGLNVGSATAASTGRIAVAGSGYNAMHNAIDIRNAASNSGLTTRSVSIAMYGVNEDARIVAGNETSGLGDHGYIAFFTRRSNVLTQRVTISSDGRVGIGDTIPDATLDVQGDLFVFDKAVLNGFATVAGAFRPDGELGHSSSATWIRFTGTFNSWTNFELTEGTTWSHVRYKRVGDLVFVKGLIKRSEGTGLATTPFALPLGFRPARRVIFAQFGRVAGASDTAHRVDVGTDGTVTVVSANTTSAYEYLSLDGIVFSTVLGSA